MIIKCDRCGIKDPETLIMSWFNTEMLCPKCRKAEMNHKDIQKAKDAVLAAERNGNMNFQGIGLPEDLKIK